MKPGRSHPQADRAARARGVRLAATLWAALAGPLSGAGAAPAPAAPALPPIVLPPPQRTGPLPLEQALARRRSLRHFAATPLTLRELGQLLWAAQGITAAPDRRTAPSAGATYPLALYLVAGAVEGLAAGVYRYLPHEHSLVALGRGDLRAGVADAAYLQRWMREAPAQLVIAAQPARTQARYGSRAQRYVAMEAGSAAQNVLLQAAALGLGATLVGAFNDAALGELLALPAGEQPYAVIPLGHPPGDSRPGP